jgi:hypothetical protein
MDDEKSHEQYVYAVRQQIVDTARSMLDGGLSYLLGARRLAALRHEAEVKDGDADFMISVGIDSDTDDLPLVQFARVGTNKR